jgi:hypothetical protein
MADRKLTLFEFHSHGETQFGPRQIGSEEGAAATREQQPESESSSGRSVRRSALAVVVLAVVMGVAVKAIGRLAGGMPEGYAPDVDLDREDLEPRGG